MKLFRRLRCWIRGKHLTASYWGVDGDPKNPKLYGCWYCGTNLKEET